MDFDSLAARLHNGISEQKSFFESFAIRLEQLLPGIVTVTHKKKLFSKTNEIESLRASVEPFVYSLTLSSQGIVAQKSKVVRNITLKTDKIDFKTWLEDFVEAMSKATENDKDTRDALDDFLFYL